jgi:hypothetical protein
MSDTDHFQDTKRQWLSTVLGVKLLAVAGGQPGNSNGSVSPKPGTP